jgi:hypothetical protein
MASTDMATKQPPAFGPSRPVQLLIRKNGLSIDIVTMTSKLHKGVLQASLCATVQLKAHVATYPREIFCRVAQLFRDKFG